jgi:hypothetical protein
LRIVPQTQIKDAILSFLNGEEYDPLQGKKMEILMWMLDHGYTEKKLKEIFSSFYNWKKEWERKY